MKSMLSVWKMISPAIRVRCLAVIVAAGVGAYFSTIWPIMLGRVYTAVSDGSGQPVTAALGWLGAFGLAYLASEAVNTGKRVLVDTTVAKNEEQVRGKILHKMLRMPVSYFCNVLSAERSAQISQGVEGISQIIRMFCNDVVATLLTAVFTLVQVLRQAPLSVVGVMAVYLVSSILISAVQIRTQNGVREAMIKTRNRLEGETSQSIQNIEMIRSRGAVDYEVKRLSGPVGALCRQEKNHGCYMAGFDGLKKLVMILSQVWLLMVCLWQVQQGSMAGGTVVGVCLLFQQLARPIDEVYRLLDDGASCFVKVKTMIRLQNAQEDAIFQQDEGHKVHEDTENKIVFTNVAISDPTGAKVLGQYPHVEIPCTGVTVLDGASGCGKTTLLRGLSRFYPVKEGTITYKGNDVLDFGESELSHRIYYLPQSVLLVAGTIRENLIYGLKRSVRDEELLDALAKACLLDGLLSRKPVANPAEVLEYKVGQGGAGLSGGEAQRLVLARVFLSRAELYIFDEATSNIDKQTAVQIFENVKVHAQKIKAGIVAISHDQEIVAQGDRVIHVTNTLKMSA